MAPVSKFLEFNRWPASVFPRHRQILTPDRTSLKEISTFGYFMYNSFAHGIQSHHSMGNRWGNSGNSVRLYFGGGSKITADGDCSHEIKRRLLLGRKVMTNWYSIFKSRDVTLLTKVRLVKAMVFPVVMYGCESWIVKKAEVPKNWCFWTVVLEKTLESLGLQGDPTSPFWRRSALGFLWKEWC